MKDFCRGKSVSEMTANLFICDRGGALHSTVYTPQLNSIIASLHTVVLRPPIQGSENKTQPIPFSDSLCPPPPLQNRQLLLS